MQSAMFQEKPNSAQLMMWAPCSGAGRELLCTKVLAAAEAWVALAQTTDLE